MGFNRVSLGVQTLSSESLKFLNRAHSVEDSLRALDVSIEIFGRRGVSVDILLGIPNESFDQIESTLSLVIQKGVGNISCYILSVEENTKLHQMVLKDPGLISNEAEKYEFCSKFLQSDYLHYEISSFSKRSMPKSRAKHNSIYWKPEIDFFGFGMGAASFLNGKRFTRPKTLKGYFNFVDELEKNSEVLLLMGVKEREDLKTMLKYQLMGKLRTIEGVNFSQLCEVLEKYFPLNTETKAAVAGVFIKIKKDYPEHFHSTFESDLILKESAYIILDSILEILFEEIEINLNC